MTVRAGRSKGSSPVRTVASPGPTDESGEGLKLAPGNLGTGRAADRPAARRVCWGVFLLSLAAYLLTANGHLQIPDAEYFYRMARAVALDHSFAIKPLESGDKVPGARGPDGRFYAQYAPGLPLALAPLVLIGRGLADPVATLVPHYRWGQDGQADLGARFLVSYFNAPLTAATAALLARLVLQLGYPPSAAAFTGLAFALASPAWGQARSLFAEPLQGLLLLVGCSVLLRATPARAWLGGGALALAVLVKLTGLLALPAFLLLPDSRGRPLWRSPALAGAIIAPVLGAVAVHGLYNFARFGNLLATGYKTANATRGIDFGRSPLIGLYGLLLSPGRGIFIFAPPLLAAVWSYRAFHRRQPSVGFAFAALAALWLVVHACWRDWDAGWGWGPRYLLPLLPFALVPLAACWLHPRARLAALGLAVVGALIQLPGAAVDFMDRGTQVMKAYRHYREQCGCAVPDLKEWWYFDPAHSDIPGQAELMFTGKLDLAWLLFRDTWVAPLTLGLAFALALAGLCLLRARDSGAAARRSFGSVRP